jgi:tetratricopeptide (TPR) repeat protein
VTLSRALAAAPLLFIAVLARAEVDKSCDASGFNKTASACADPSSKECQLRYARVVYHCMEDIAKLQKDPNASPQAKQDVQARYDSLKAIGDANPDLMKSSLATLNQTNGDYERVKMVVNGAQGHPPSENADGKTPSSEGGTDNPTGSVEGTPTLSPTARMAQNALAGGDPAKAQSLLDKGLENDPNDSSALSLRAQILSEKGDREGALSDARRALAINPHDGASRALISGYEGLSHAQSKTRSAKLDFGASPEAGGMNGPGGRALGAGKDGGSGPEKLAAPGAAPSAAGGYAFSALSPAAPLLQQAAMRLALGDVSGALLLLMRARDLDPKNPAVPTMIAKVSNAAKNYAGAIAAAQQALALDPNDAAALREKAYAEFSLGQLDLALADAERAVQLDPKNGLGYLYRAMIEEKLGRDADARRDYESAQNLDATLAPLADEGLKRLGGVQSARPSAPLSPPVQRRLFEGGMIAFSALLIVLGLTGTAAGRELTRRARVALTPGRGRPEPGDVAATVVAGDFLGDHYRIVRELGRGGMGVVYEAVDETLKRRVAIKQLQREGRGSPEETERFLHEARLVAQLKHPHIAEIYSVVGGGDLLLVFEHIDGKSLDQVVGNGRRLPVAEARRLLSEITSALDYAHSHRIVHRDLKPSNIMLTRAGAVKVMDFGIAHQSRSGADVTRTEFASGTPPYMSPEQMSGSVSPAADVYALGVMAYEMLTGRRPFEGPDYMEQKLRRDFVQATRLDANLPPALDAFFSRALDPDPTKRLAGARAFADEFAAAFGATPSRA